MNEQYFLWDDDVPVRFDLTEQGQWVVDGLNLIEMARSVIWRYQQGDVAPEGAMTPQQAVESITSLVSLYIPAYDTAVLPDWIRESSLICDKDGGPLDLGGEDDPLCACGHLFSLHQTGDGPWAGFCYALPQTGQLTGESCQCESPTREEDIK